MKWLFCVFYVLCVALDKNVVLSKAFLSPPSFAGLVSSASASSSASQQYTNIADLRRERSDLQEEKPLADDDFFKSAEEGVQHNNNEATPTLLQKKIRKILAKLQFLGSFSNPGNNGHNNEDDFDKEKEEFDKEFEEDSKTSSDNNQTEITITLKNPETSNKQLIKLLPVSNSDEESTGYTYKLLKKNTKSKMELDSNLEDFSDFKPFEPSTFKMKTKVKKAAIKDSDVTNEGSNNKFSVSPQSVGLYFMELIASAVGLAYGAVAQLQSQMTSTPQPT